MSAKEKPLVEGQSLTAIQSHTHNHAQQKQEMHVVVLSDYTRVKLIKVKNNPKQSKTDETRSNHLNNIEPNI